MLFSDDLKIITGPTKKLEKNSFDKILETLFAFRFGAIENQDYGNQFILNEFAGVPIGKKIPGRLQHGWERLTDSRSYYRNNVLRTFVWSKDAETYARSRGWDKFTSIGAPWLYLLEILNSQGWESANHQDGNLKSISELWVYGYHSTSFVNDLTENLYEFLLTAKRASTNCNVCVILSWHDFKISQTMRERDFKDLNIVTLGKRNCQSSALSHLYRLHLLLSQVKTIVTDYPTTMVFYGLTLGCEVRWLKNSNHKQAIALARLCNNFDLVAHLEMSNLRPKDFTDFAFLNLGMESFRTPEELKEIFCW